MALHMGLYMHILHSTGQKFKVCGRFLYILAFDRHFVTSDYIIKIDGAPVVEWTKASSMVYCKSVLKRAP